MAFTLTWDVVGTKKYTTGVDRGVLWTGTVDSSTGALTWSDGVAWQGLRTVDQSPDGADEQAFYADNIKYLSLRGVENFGGTIGCYYTPDEFDACDGTVSLTTGLKVGMQVRKPFCFCYRTLVGNDLQYDTYGYIIHIVYNATASPSSRSYESVNDSPSPIELSYDFTTTPIEIAGTTLRPVSHIEIYSPSLLGLTASTTPTLAKYTTNFEAVEAYLYGTVGGTGDAAKSRLLLPDAIKTMLEAT